MKNTRDVIIDNNNTYYKDRRKEVRDMYVFLNKVDKNLSILNEKIDTHLTAYAEYKHDIKYEIDNINKSLNGNGKRGLKDRITRLEIILAIIIAMLPIVNIGSKVVLKFLG